MADIKQLIEQRCGVPAALLTGDNDEENIAQAKALLAYRRTGSARKHAQTAREQFIEWAAAALGSQEDQTAADTSAAAALAELEREIRGGYPEIRDGQPQNFTPGDGRPTREQFADYMAEIFPGGGNGGGLI